MAKVSFHMYDVQHKHWVISTLLPHIHVPLMQQNIWSQAEALESAMKLEPSPVKKTGVGMVQIQPQLDNILLHI